MNSIKRLTLILFAVCAALSAAAQVDGEVSRQDTLYIIEEEITYDTLYLRDSLLYPSAMSKEELIEAFRSDRGIGHIYYQKGGIYFTGVNGLFRLNKTDLQELFSASEYADYRKAKRNMYLSIPFYVASGGALAIAGIGLYQFGASFVQSAKYSEQILNSDKLAIDIWRSAMCGLFLFGGGTLVATGCIIPAIILHVKGKASINALVNNFNAPTTAMQIRIGPTPAGIGLTLSF